MDPLTYWYGFGPKDLDPDPAIFAFDIQDANKKVLF